jgi:lipopolysaccharide transport system permease protein
MKFAGYYFLQNLIHNRHLLWQLVQRDFQQRYIGSAGGWIWAVVHPMILMLSYIFVFQLCLRMPPPQNLTTNYTIYLVCGFLPWMLFQETVSRSATVLLENQNLITKTVFPSEILPVAVFCSSFIGHVIALVLAVLLLIFWENHFSIQVYLLPIYMLAVALFGIGLGWIVASFQVYLRDTAQAVSVLLTLWFWVTPIFIDQSVIPEGLRFLVKFNPLAGIVQGYRERLITPLYPQVDAIFAVLLPAVVMFVLGGLVFRYLKKGFADVL